MRIAVLGTGLIGGSIGLAARERVPDASVTGFDVSSAAVDTAVARGALDDAAGTPEEALAGAEACFVCAPVGALPALVEEALATAPQDCVVSDVGSTKRVVAPFTADERFVGGHPVAGAEAAGAEHARADLFEGASWYLSPGKRTSGLLLERLHRLIAAFGALPAAIDPETHDRVLAVVSHLPHVLANVLVSQAARVLQAEGEALPRIGPSFRDATRVGGANPPVWADIYSANSQAIADAVEESARSLGEAAEMLRAGDSGALERWHGAAREDRRRLLEAELAGGPVHELRLVVPNRPGVVAQVALALGRAGVNIVDMALAPAADMRSGAMTLWVAGDDAAARARGLVEELGFPAASAE